MKNGNVLDGRRVLIVEDEYLIAEELSGAVADAGAEIVGPAGDVATAIAFVTTGTPIDCAVLDINLAGVMVFPVADALVERGVPFLFTTGYDSGIVPERHAGVLHCEKPVQTSAIVRALAAASVRPHDA